MEEHFLSARQEQVIIISLLVTVEAASFLPYLPFFFKDVAIYEPERAVKLLPACFSY